MIAAVLEFTDPVSQRQAIHGCARITEVKGPRDYIFGVIVPQIVGVFDKTPASMKLTLCQTLDSQDSTERKHCIAWTQLFEFL